MLLTDFLALDTSITTDVIQEAYLDIIRKISLYPALFPVRFHYGASFDDLDLPGVMQNGSEIAIKEVSSLQGMNSVSALESDGQRQVLEVGNMGQIRGFDNGFDKGYHVAYDWGTTAFSEGFSSAFNGTGHFWLLDAEHETVPDILWRGDSLYCENVDFAMAWMIAYVYPYPLLVQNETPYTITHLYSVETMYDMYNGGFDTGYGSGFTTKRILEIDNFLVLPLFAKCKSILYSEYSDIASSALCDTLALDYINYYNMSQAWIRESTPTFVAATNFPMEA